MPKTYTATTYTYGELPTAAAKKRAIEWARDSENETFSDFHAGDITRTFYEKLTELGYPCHDPDDSKNRNLNRRQSEELGVIEWSLTCCQGDGVAFYGPVNMEIVSKRLLKGDILTGWKALDDAGDIRVKLGRISNHYSHWNTMRVEVESNQGDEKLIDAIEKIILEDVQQTSRELEKIGYDEIEHILSDETLAENLEANEDEFHIDGSRASTKHLSQTEET